MRFLHVFIFLISPLPAFMQPAFNDTEKMASLCKVWGFLKYHHPEVAAGRMDWDQVLLEKIEKVDAANDPAELNEIYLSWIGGLDKVKPCKKCDNPLPPDAVTYNLDTGWIERNGIFSDSLKHVLQYIRNNRHQGDNHYVSQTRSVGNTLYENEKPYTGMSYPPEPVRLLGLFRYWNIVNYFYPYKYLVGEEWDVVLNDMIPVFRKAGDTLAYQLAIKELTARLNDGHAGIPTSHTKQFYGTLKPACSLEIIDGQVVATGFYNDSLARMDDIRLGDVFLKIGGVPVNDIVQQRWKYTPGSNHDARMRNLAFSVLNGATDTVSVIFDRNGKEYAKIIRRYPAAGFPFLPVSGQTFDMLKKHIGYVNLGALEVGAVDTIMPKMMTRDAIIFDVRNYPKGTMLKIAAWLTDGLVPYAKFTRPVLATPGLFEWDRPNYCGSKGKKNFKGKIVLLINDVTISHAEITCMALKTAPNVTCVGSRTAGTDGNVSTITFPGGYRTWMTGIGVYYPDGRPTQRTGIVPDIEVKPTIEGIRAGRDEVLERAIRFIKTGE